MFLLAFTLVFVCVIIWGISILFRPSDYKDPIHDPPIRWAFWFLVPTEKPVVEAVDELERKLWRDDHGKITWQSGQQCNYLCGTLYITSSTRRKTMIEGRAILELALPGHKEGKYTIWILPPGSTGNV